MATHLHSKPYVCLLPTSWLQNNKRVETSLSMGNVIGCPTQCLCVYQALIIKLQLKCVFSRKTFYVVSLTTYFQWPNIGYHMHFIFRACPYYYISTKTADTLVVCCNQTCAYNSYQVFYKHDHTFIG